MPTITNVKTQQKNKTRVSIFLDKKYSFSLSLLQLEETKLQVGDSLTSADIERYKKLSGVGKLQDRALQKLARRPHSEWEIRDYLRRKDVSQPDIDAIIAKLKGYGYIDDFDFAESWVRSRRALKARSKRRLKQELIKKRVATQVIDEVLEQDEVTDQKVLTELVEKKRRHSRYQDEKKLIAYLVRQGFSYGDVKDAVKEHTE